MASNKPTTVEDYLSSLPADRRAAISAVRDVVRKNLPRGFEEGLQYGMISYYVPLSRYPDTYNGQALAIASIAAQKQHMALYLMGVYGDPATAEWFAAEYAKSGKKLDMGKSCVRFKKLEDLPLDVVGRVIARVSLESFIEHYERARAETASGKRAAAKPATKKAPAAKKTATKTTAAKKTAAKKTAAKKTATKRS